MSAVATMEDFEALLNESFEHDTPEEGSVVKGTVIAVEKTWKHGERFAKAVGVACLLFAVAVVFEPSSRDSPCGLSR